MAMMLRQTTANIVLAAASVLIGLLLVEAALRLIYPVAIMNIEAERARPAGEELIVADDSLGLRPALKTSMYDGDGVLFGRSISAKTSNPYKILFIGDSVTGRGRIVAALAEALGSERTAFLNGGVDGYNIQQEVEFFLRYQAGTNPDAIVHQLHINDLQPTTLVVRGRDGRVRSYSPRMKPASVNAWLYRHSQIYRFYILQFRSRFSQDELRAAAYDALRKMRDYARERKIAYHVFLFPNLAPYEEWSAHDKASRDYLLRISGELGLGTVDLWPLAERLIRLGVDAQDSPGDTWHPNRRFAEEAARYLIARIPALTPPAPKD